jgi:surfeit locus 1 family protein
VGDKPYSEGNAAASERASLGRPALATAILVMAVPLFISAGFWQLSRAAEKQALLDQFAQALQRPVSGELSPQTPLTGNRYRRFRVSGRFDPQHQILLDNMTQGGKNGYQVLTPLRMAGWTVLVNRGWVPGSPDRSELPDVAVADNMRTLTGRLSNLPSPGLRLAAGDSQERGWPRRMLFPQRGELEAALGVSLPDFQLLLEAGEADGYTRDWQLVAPEFGPAKHQGYALQWFSFAGLTVIFYAVLMRGWFKSRRSHHQPTTSS